MTPSAILTEKTIETIEWTPEGVVMIDQTRLPRETAFVTCCNYVEVADAIRDMIIRGAPAIGVAAAMGVAIGALLVGFFTGSGRGSDVRTQEP